MICIHVYHTIDAFSRILIRFFVLTDINNIQKKIKHYESPSQHKKQNT